MMRANAELIAQAKAELAELRLDELVQAKIVHPEGDFLPVVRYPEIVTYPTVDPDEIFSHEAERPGIPYAAYVHVPFCASKCVYCHWVTIEEPDEALVDRYLTYIDREMDLALARLGRDKLPISTVLFGGGTPTYLTARQLERLLTGFVAHFDLSDCRQLSFEAEPATLLGKEGKARLQVLRDFGVHRISLGVQSFRDEILFKMGRSHNARQVYQAVDEIRRAGFESLMIDLIYAYPGQSMDDWLHSLEQAVACGVDGWQLYRLRIQQHGLLQGDIIRLLESHPGLFPSRDETYLMKMVGNLISKENGYHEYMRRIFATDNRHTTHFMWDYCCYLTNVVGLGPSAWSNYHRTFTINAGDDFDRYCALIDRGKLPVYKGLYRDPETEARRSLVTPLKNDRVFKKAFKDRVGLDADEHFGPELERLKGFGLIEEDDKTIFLTERGRFFADDTVVQLHQKKYNPFPELAHDLMPE